MKLKYVLCSSAIVLSLSAFSHVQASPLNYASGFLSMFESQDQVKRMGSFRRPRGATPSTYQSKNTATQPRREAPAQQAAPATQQTAPAAANRAAPNAQGAPAAAANQGRMGGGSPFLSSMAGTMAGMMVYSMLFPSAASAQGAEPKEPAKLTDEELEQSISELGSMQEKLKTQKQDLLYGNDANKEEAIAQIDADLQKMKDLELALMKEQIERFKSKN